MDGGPQPSDDPFDAIRPALTGVAYRVVGSRTDAEDVIQEAWLRWAAVDHTSVDDPRRFLFRLVTNASIDWLRRSSARREDYVGPWLPEPIALEPSGDAVAERAETLELAVLVLLQTLPPIERVVFVLHRAFGFAYDEIAAIVGRTERAVRQLGYRARRSLEQGRRRTAVGRDEAAAVARRFIDAATGGDLLAMLELLAPTVTFVADANGLSEMPREPLHGADSVARYFASVATFWPVDRKVRPLWINGQPGVLVDGNGSAFLALVFTIDGAGRVTSLHAVRNPAKLGWLAPRAAPPDSLL